MSKLNKWDGLILLAAGCILAVLLFVHPVLGVADNGDFIRIMRTVGLADLTPDEPYEERYFAFMHRQFQIVSPGVGEYLSTEIIVVFLAIWLNKLVNGQVFDIRFLGALYSLTLLAALALLLRLRLLASPAAKAAFAVLFLLMFLDVGYTAYFNSLFGEPMSFVFMLLALAAALRLTELRPPGAMWLFVFAGAALFMSASKVQNAPAGVIFALLALRFLPLSGARSWKRSGIVLALVLLASSAAVYWTAPKELRVINQYQSVFYGILKDSPSPEQDLRDLGLDPRLAVLADTNYFTKDTAIPQQSPELKRLFYPHISHGKIAWFYLTHPQRFWTKLQATAANAMTIHAYYLGNYDKEAGFEKGAVSASYSLWSEFKAKMAPASLWLLLSFFALYYAVLGSLYTGEPSRGRRAAYEVLMAVGAIAVISFLVPLIGDGEADMKKHLFLFNVCFDIMIVSALVWLVHLSSKLAKRRAF